MKVLYNSTRWQNFVQKIEEDFKLKTYPHFDPYFNFPKDKGKLQFLLADPNLERVKSHSFLPFLKILNKTPRYRYQEDKESYALETKIRPISFASHFDTYIFSFYSFALNEIYQQYIRKSGFEKVVLAYRDDLDGKCNIQFAKEVFDLINIRNQAKGSCSAIALDIKGYFDSIDHSILKSMWCKLIDEDQLPKDQYALYRVLTNYSYVNYTSFLKHFKINLKKIKKEHSKKKSGTRKSFKSILDLIPDTLVGSRMKDKMNLLRRRKLIAHNSTYDKTLNKRVNKKSGIPQGSSISALLSNVYLMEFDDILYKEGLKKGFTYRRYCDDLLIICDVDQANEIMKYVIELISDKYKLIIQARKTDIIDFHQTSSGTFGSFKRIYDEKTDLYSISSIEESKIKNLQYLGFEFNGHRIYIRPSSLSRYFRKMKARVVKSVSMAYSKSSKSGTIFKKQIYSRYSHIGKRNFLSYAFNASKKYYKNSKGEIKEGLDSSSIKRQLSSHMAILKKEIEKTSIQKAKQKKVKIVKS